MTDPHPDWRLLAKDEFRHGLDNWYTELETGGAVTASDGELRIDVPGGATVWFRRPVAAPYVVEYTAVPVSEGGPHDRVSDLNSFWSARDARSPNDLFGTTRTGGFADCDQLRAYYTGFGGNANTTTRFRRYVGKSDNRPLLDDRTTPLLTPNRPHRIRHVVDGGTVQYWFDGRVLFEYADPEPYTSGWFGFRTVASHLRISGFAIWRPGAPA